MIRNFLNTKIAKVSIIIIFILFILSYFTGVTLFLIGINVPLYSCEFHMPSFFSVSDCIFVDNGGTYYQKRNGLLLASNSFEENYTPSHLWKFFDSNLRQICSTSDDEYLYIYANNYHYYKLDDDAYKSIVFAYNKSLNLEYFLDISESHYQTLDMVFLDDNLYMLTITNEDDNYQLHQFNVFSKRDVVLLDNVKENDLYSDENISIALKIYSHNNGEIRIIADNTSMFYKNGELFLLDNEISASQDCLKIKNNNNEFLFNIELKCPCLYEKAYIYNNQIIFGVYDFVKRDDCGSIYGNCVCRFGKSYSFIFDLETKTIFQQKEFELGSILIDFDFEQPVYYYNKSLYKGDVLLRNCDEPVYGEIVTADYCVHITSYYKKYYVSYKNGIIYGL